MAKNFPLSFYDSSAANNHGGTDKSKNLHYNIHNSNNLSIFTSDGSFDVYTFKEQPSEADSPERSYSLIIIKNSGAHNSHINVTDINLNTTVSAENANFSLVTAYNQILEGDSTGDFGGAANILTPAQYQTVLDGLSPAGVDLDTPNPLGYIELGSNSGTIENADFGGTTRYIPFYNPSVIVSNTSDSDGISANNLGGSTVYPEYCAFLLKCDPQNSINIGPNDNNTLTINCNGFDPVIFNLTVVGYRTGLLNYEQGFVNTSNNSYTSLNSKTFLTHSISSVLTGANQNNSNNANPSGSPFFNPGVVAENNFVFQYVPDGYDPSTLAFNVDSQQSQNIQWLRFFDTTTNTGGVRLILNEGLDIETYAAHSEQTQEGSLLNKYKPLENNSTNQVLTFFTDESLTDNQSTDTETTLVATSDSESHVFLSNQNVYARITNNNSNNSDLHYLSLNNSGVNASKYLRPDSSDVTSAKNNWRPYWSRIGVLYNPFYVDSNQGETTTLDSVHVLSGAYNVFSTNSTTYQKFMNHDFGSAQLSGELENIETYLDSASRSGTTTNIRQLIHGYGVNTNVEATPKESVFNLVPQGIGTNSTTGGRLDIYKHHHIYDYFQFPVIYDDTTVEFNDILLRFNNFAGKDNCYIQNFKFTSLTGGNVNTLDSTNNTQSTQSVVHSNSEFNPTKIKTTGGTDIQNTAQVFSAGYTSQVAYSSYNDNANNQYLANSKYKDVKLVYNFSPTRNQNSNEFYWDKDSLPETSQTTIDKLGRKKHSGSSAFYTSSLDFMTGATQSSNSNNVITQVALSTSAILSKNITFQYNAISLIKHKPPLSIVGPPSVTTNGDWDTSNSDLFVTEYSGVNKFGTHDASSSAREAISNDIVVSSSQPITHTTANNTHGMTNHVYALQHKYASVVRTNDYYFRKYPLNGKMVFKYENYFQNLNLHQAANTNLTTAYGILPGPLAVGRFASNSNALAGSETNKTLLTSSSLVNSANTAIFESFLSVNIKNKGNKLTHLVSVELENEVGEAHTGHFGDPRFLYGSGQQTVNSSGVVSAGQGEYYEVPVSDASANTVKVAPTNSIVKVCSATSGGSTVVGVNNVTGLKVGQVLFPENTTFCPAGTKIASINSGANQITLTNASANEASKDVVFDYENPEYVIWDVVKGKRPNATNTLNRFTSVSPLDVYVSPALNSSNGQMDLSQANTGSTNFSDIFHATYALGANSAATSAIWVGAYVIPDAANAAGILPGTKVASITSGNVWVLEPKPTTSKNAQQVTLRIVQPDRTQFNSDFFTNSADMNVSIGTDNMKFAYDSKGDLARTNDVAGDDEITEASLYDNYTNPEHLEQGAPHIYFAANVAAIGTNDIDVASFYNRVRIKYLVFDKLDAYGLNQARITNNSISGNRWNSSRANEAHVYEDVYLVKVNFTNTVPELEVSDLEGDTSDSNAIIDFGVLSTG